MIVVAADLNLKMGSPDAYNSVRKRLGEPHTLNSLAGEVYMSRRSFTRHFRALTGTTVQTWLLTERIALTQQLLESSNQTIDSIAGSVGFGSVASLRQHFREALGVTPAAWRTRFRVLGLTSPLQARSIA